MKKINEFDLAFIVDTTGSMGGLIEDAQKRMIQMIDALTASADVDMRLGVVEYRDHPPQDRMVYRAYPLTADLAKAKRTINRLKANGGGDEPEAVFAGVVAACEQLEWRAHAHRMAVLVGDAPPHGVGCRGDGFARGCPSGETMESVSAKAEEARVTLYALGLGRSCFESFERMSRLTGGQFFRAERAGEAMNRMQEILQSEFGQLDFDRDVFDAWVGSAVPDVESIAEQVGATPPKVAASVSRLQSRGLLTACASA